MEPKRLARVLFAMAVLCGASEGRGAGFEFPDNGVEALGRGAAFTAKADSLLAIQYNIAGLAKLKGTHFMIDLMLANQSFSFARSGAYPDGTLSQSGIDVSGQPFPRIHKKPEVYPIPIGGVATDFGLKKFTFALGINGPSSMGRKKFPEWVKLANGVTDAPAPQRFELLDEDILIGFLTLGAAWRPLDWLHIGAAFQYTISNVKEHVYAITYTNPNQCPNGEAYACSTKAGINVWDWFIPTGIVSVLARGPHPKIDHLEVGASYRIPFEANTSGSASVSPPPVMSTLDIVATGAGLKTKMPGSLRTGVRWFFGPREDEKGDVEVDFVWEGWSRVKSFTSTFTTNLLGTLTLDVPHEYKDTYSVRTGGAYNFKLGRYKDQRLTLRAGFFWESAAAPMQWTRLDFDAFERFGATVGAGYKWRGITFNLAFAYIYMPTRNVTDSKVTPLYPVEFSPPAEHVAYINNGKFESRMWVLSLGAAVSFNELLKRGSGLR